MILALNVSTLIFLLIVAAAIIVASWNTGSKLFYVRTALLLIPVVAQIRQVLSATGDLDNYPLFIFLVFFLLRIIGPLLNWHTHLLLKRDIRFFNVLHIATYALLGYVAFDFVRVLALPHIERVAYVNQAFNEPSLFSFTYPIIQLLHVGQAVWITSRSDLDRDSAKDIIFLKVILYTVVVMLIALQLGYIFLARQTVELVMAPVIFLCVFSTIIFVSIQYSAVHNKSINTSSDSLKKEIASLSARENEVLQLIAEGKTDKEISATINISLNTVRTYCKRIYSKLDIKNRTEAANFYHRAS